jgi:uncharacterized protein YbjQ (UPF0145 family)
MSVLVTTTNSIDGYRVVHYISPIVTNVVVGTGFFTDLFAGVTDFFGGRSNAYQDQLNELYNIALKQLKEEAEKRGANCIVGVKIDFDEISGKGMQMFMLNAFGTAVFIKPEEEYLSLKQAGKLQEIIDKLEELNKPVPETLQPSLKTLKPGDKATIKKETRLQSLYIPGSDLVLLLKPGDILEVIQQRGYWINVKINNKTGWCLTNDLE